MLIKEGTYNEVLVKQVKALGQEVIDRAEELVSNAETIFANIKKSGYSLDSILSNAEKINEVNKAYKNMTQSTGSMSYNDKITKSIESMTVLH